MTQRTRSLYAFDPATQKVRLVVQVTPNGWTEDELEKIFAGLIPVLGNANIRVCILLSTDTAFLVRFEEKEQHFDIDEVEVADVLSPLQFDGDPAKLYETASKWLSELIGGSEPFFSGAKLIKRVPEVVPVLAGTTVRERDGSIGLPTEQVTTPVRE